MNALQAGSPPPKFVMTLYVSICDVETNKQIQSLRKALDECFKGDAWELNLVEVLDTPEKAIANDIFTTPTLVKESPSPIVKVLNGLNNIPNVVQVITHDGLH